MQPYVLKPHFVRSSVFMKENDSRVPHELFNTVNEKPVLTGFSYPLPSKKSDYTCSAVGNNGVVWYAGKTGVTRFDKKAEREEDIIMYFSDRRHLPSNNVKAILPDGDGLWALTDEGVAHIEMTMISAEKKAELLLEETQKYVMRRGMVSQRDLREARNYESRYPYAECDNDGLFTSCHTIGELFRYATLRREKGENNPETINARKGATESCEACLLLMYIHGREEGFISRSYHITGEPVPDDGIFYKRDGDKAVCVKTTESQKQGRTGEISPATHPIPERLRHFLTDIGMNEDDVTYKADTSSDEVTSHFLQMKLAHDILGSDDPELDEIIKDACKRTTLHIINGNFEFLESSGRPTTWAKWSKEYFKEDGSGYVDAPLNAAEMLMFLKITMYITGETGLWQETYDKLIADGYAELTTKHFDRFFQGAMGVQCAPEEDLMYGDHMLALAAFWMLTTLEKDEKLLATYREGFCSWKGTFLREHNPGYDFVFKLSCPDEEIDIEKDVDWINRFEPQRLTSSVNLYRHDVPLRVSRGDCELSEISALLMPDERLIKKYDHNPFNAVPNTWKRDYRIEGCYVYTFAYWIGRYYGFIAEEG